ncbi:MAG: hypothetical protein V3R98_09030, partial [Alphaproteobacteria bacterium]
MAQAESLSHGRRLSRAFFALVGILLVLALIHDGAAAETGAPVPVDAMHRGGLYLPSELPGYVVPATTVDTTAHITVSGLVGRARITQRF